MQEISREELKAQLMAKLDELEREEEQEMQTENTVTEETEEVVDVPEEEIKPVEQEQPKQEQHAFDPNIIKFLLSDGMVYQAAKSAINWDQFNSNITQILENYKTVYDARISLLMEKDHEKRNENAKNLTTNCMQMIKDFGIENPKYDKIDFENDVEKALVLSFDVSTILETLINTNELNNIQKKVLEMVGIGLNITNVTYCKTQEAIK